MATTRKTDHYRVSYSKISKWQTCKYAFHLRYSEKLRKRQKAKALQTGALIHLMIDADANGDNPMAALERAVKKAGPMFASERDEFNQMIDDIRAIMKDYFLMKWGDGELKYLRKNQKSAEHEFEVNLAPGILLTGKLDGLAITQANKRRWLVENKSFSRMPNEDHRWRNLQGNIYHHVVRLLGLPPLDGLCWNYIRTKPPSVPQLLKNGKISQKRLDTLPSKLHEFFKKNKINPGEYSRMLSTADQNRSQYFIRVFSPVRPKVVARVVRDFIEEAQIMAEYDGKWKTKSIGRHCEWCEFEPICRAELTGGDADYVRKKEYYHRDDEDAPIQIGD